jgi:hypothetical protein
MAKRMGKGMKMMKMGMKMKGMKEGSKAEEKMDRMMAKKPKMKKAY